LHLTFYSKQPTYNPQKTLLDKPQKVRNGAKNRQDRKEAGGFGGTVIYSDKFEADKKLPTAVPIPGAKIDNAIGNTDMNILKILLYS